MANKKLRKKRAGSFSIKYLKYLFLKERKELIPELEEDFRQRRYLEDEFSKDGKVLVEPERSAENPNFYNLKNYISQNAKKENNKDTSKSRINQYMEEVRKQIDKYDAEDENAFNRELKSISEPHFNRNYLNKRANSRSSFKDDGFRNENFYSSGNFNKQDTDSQDIDDFLLENTAKKNSPYSRKSQNSSNAQGNNKRRSSDFLLDEYKYDSDDDLSFIDDKYLSSLDDEDFFNTKRKSPSTSKKQNNKNDIDDFLDKYN